jgi:hypothetical protein
MINKSDPLRTVHLRPYRKGMGPTFTLRTYSARGDRIAYTLTQREDGRAVTLFEGADFRPSPLHPIDGDESMAALLGFLTLRPGDTDADYFSDYTDTQHAFCRDHAEALGFEASQRFGEY